MGKQNATVNDERSKNHVVHHTIRARRPSTVLHRVGLAARLLDVERGPDDLTLINPTIVARAGDEGWYDEGCLSFPSIYAEVKRPTEVQVRWTGLDGQEQERQFAGIWATCVQHEIDHLDGKLFIDYLGPLKRQMITRKMEKLKRERARAL